MPLTSSRESAVKICRNSHCRNKVQPLLSRKACRTEFGKATYPCDFYSLGKRRKTKNAWAFSARIGAECHEESSVFGAAPFFFCPNQNFSKRRFDK